MITIIDAVMGSGKSTAMFQRLNTELGQKFIILTPLTSEVTRYKEEISSTYLGKRDDVVALDKKTGKRMKERFIDAVRDNKTVVTTHKLFSDLNEWELSSLLNLGDYSLIIDETITLVDQTGLRSGDLQDLVDLKHVEVIPHASITGLECYRMLSSGEEYLGRGKGAPLYSILSSVSGRHVYKVKSTNVVFVVPPEKLTVFQGTTIMTYMFEESETHAWLELFALKYDHQELSRTGPTSFDYRQHDGTYSGDKFKSLFTIYEHSINDIGVKKRRASQTPLTSSWYKHKSTVRRVEIKKVAKNTRTFFRHMTDDKGAIKGVMLWTCLEECRHQLRHSEFDPRGGGKNWLAYNYKATNDYADRLYLAFLVNVHPLQNIVDFFNEHKILFSRDSYALSTVLQWIWRSAIRDEKAVILYLPSERMRKLVKGWLMDPLLKALGAKP